MRNMDEHVRRNLPILVPSHLLLLLLQHRVTVDPEAVQAGVLGVTPVTQNPQLHDLEGGAVVLLRSCENKSQIDAL